jgi:hypothetical protein
MSSSNGHNRTVGMDGLEYRVVAGRGCRIDTTDDTTVVYDEETGIMLATVYGEPDAALADLEDDVLANGW